MRVLRARLASPSSIAPKQRSRRLSNVCYPACSWSEAAPRRPTRRHAAPCPGMNHPARNWREVKVRRRPDLPAPSVAPAAHDMPDFASGRRQTAGVDAPGPNPAGSNARPIGRRPQGQPAGKHSPANGREPPHVAAESPCSPDARPSLIPTESTRCRCRIPDASGAEAQVDCSWNLIAGDRNLSEALVRQAGELTIAFAATRSSGPEASDERFVSHMHRELREARAEQSTRQRPGLTAPARGRMHK